MPLAPIDWIIIIAYFAIALGVGLYYRERAGSSLVRTDGDGTDPSSCWLSA